MPDTKTLEFSRQLPLEPSRLWPLLTEPKHREAWGAPEEGMVLEVDVADTREGGFETHRCGPAEAPDFLVDTRWYKLNEPNLAVFTETLRVGEETIFTSLVTYAVIPTEDGSTLEISVAISSFAGPDAFAEVAQGWEGGLANLDALARRMADEAA